MKFSFSFKLCWTHICICLHCTECSGHAWHNILQESQVIDLPTLDTPTLHSELGLKAICPVRALRLYTDHTGGWSRPVTSWPLQFGMTHCICTPYVRVNVSRSVHILSPCDWASPACLRLAETACNVCEAVMMPAWTLNLIYIWIRCVRLRLVLYSYLDVGIDEWGLLWHRPPLMASDCVATFAQFSL